MFRSQETGYFFKPYGEDVSVKVLTMLQKWASPQDIHLQYAGKSPKDPQGGYVKLSSYQASLVFDMIISAVSNYTY